MGRDEDDIEYDEERNVYRATYDWESDDSLSAFVVDLVAAVTEASPTEFDPLYETIDPDALSELYEPTYDRALRRGGGCVRFEFEGCTVTVYWDGRVEVEPPTDP